ncbi:membrane protein insertase YidC [Sutcliffiella halmapala]
MKKITMAALLVVTVMTGCSMSEPITSDTQGVWNHYFIYPMSLLLTSVANFSGGNYGLSIIVVTILIRLLIFPLVMKQQKSTIAMQKLRPEMTALQEKYKGKKDPADQQKMQKEMMELYQAHKINPVGGCLPVLIQMPIIMAFYYAIGRTTEIAEHSFLWFSLGQSDPYFILPVVAATTTFIQTRVSLPPDIQPQMKMVMNIMPVFILIAGLTLPSALALYWVIGNLFGIGQGLFLKKRMKNLKENSSEPTVATT